MSLESAAQVWLAGLQGLLTTLLALAALGIGIYAVCAGFYRAVRALPYRVGVVVFGAAWVIVWGVATFALAYNRPDFGPTEVAGGMLAMGLAALSAAVLGHSVVFGDGGRESE